MTHPMDRTGLRGTLGHRLEGLGLLILRYGLVSIVLWVGAFTFTAAEALRAATTRPATQAVQAQMSAGPL